MDEYSAYKLLVEGTDVIEKDVKKTVKKSKALTKEEKIKKLRLTNKIKCNAKSSNVPDPISSFKELISRYNLSTEFLKCFDSLDYKSPTPVQMQSMPVMLEKRNLFTLAPTGSGKTAAFLIPLIHEVISRHKEQRQVVTPNDVDDKDNSCSPMALILSPTVELAKQTYQECLCLINGLALTDKPGVAIYLKGKKLNKMADIVISTPLRLKEALTKNDNKQLCVDRLSWLVIDESDKLLEDSINSFSYQFKVIYEKCRQSSDMRVAMFSATQTKPAIDWVNENLAPSVVFVRVGTKDAAVDTVCQELRYCYSEETKFSELKTLIGAGQLQVPCLIFLDQSNNARYLHEFIVEHGRRAGIMVAMISGQCSDTARRTVVSQFREGKVHFLICTNLLARGIDFKGVATVVNYDLPMHKEEYIHRIGRCGRAGQAGRSISFWTDEDALNGLPGVLSIMRASGQPVNEELCALVRKQRSSKRHYKGDKILKKLKRKYNTDEKDNEKDDKESKEDKVTVKRMKPNDKRRKMFVENCVVRKKFLAKKKLALSENNVDQ